MLLKPGVRLKGVSTQVSIAMSTVDSVFISHEQAPGEPTCTSINDSKHKAGSLHGKGLAFDVRLPSRTRAETYGFPWGEKIDHTDKEISSTLKAQLTEFDVILEDHQTSPWDWHIHIEYDTED